MKKLRLILVEDDEKWVIAMKLFLELEPDIEVAAVCYDYRNAVETCISCDADIILMDMNLSGNKTDGIYLAAEILYHKDVKIIMLTSMDDMEIIQNAYCAGAVNYVLKNNYKEIPSIVRKTFQGITPNEVLSKDYVRLRIQELLLPLTASEKEIFDLFREGKSRSDVQKILFVSESTLKNHIHKIIRKLDVKSIQEAVEKVGRKGFVR